MLQRLMKKNVILKMFYVGGQSCRFIPLVSVPEVSPNYFRLSTPLNPIST